MAGRASRRPLEIFAAIFVAAGFIYSFHLGTDALGASEAYSAWAAAKPGLGAIVRTPVLHDPGKQVFYYVVLHYYTRIFGLSEISLRSLSVIFSLTTLALVFAIGCRNVRRQHCAGGGCDVGVQSARGCVRAYGANVFDADCFSARTTADALAGAQASEHERRSGMRYGGRRAALHTPRRHPVYRSGRCDAGARLPSRADEIRWRGSRSL